MNRRTLFWIGGLFLALLIGCGLLFAIGINLSEFDTNVGPGVAIVRVEGIILPGEGTADLFGTMGAFSTIIVDHLKQANENEDVKAVILAVDSPGGSVYASDEIANGWLSHTTIIPLALDNSGLSGFAEKDVDTFISTGADGFRSIPAPLK